jgi:signal transduction histidine kinase
VTSQSPADIQSAANKESVLPDDTLQTITAMLRSAELEAGSAQMMDPELNLTNFLEKIAEIYEPMMAGRRDFLIIRVQTISVCSNKSLRTQMLVNLIESAIQHNASVTEIGLECRMESGRPTIRVADNGIGIPEAEHAAVLKPFRRLDASRSTRETGLGLSLASSIAWQTGPREPARRP